MKSRRRIVQAKILVTGIATALLRFTQDVLQAFADALAPAGERQLKSLNPEINLLRNGMLSRLSARLNRLERLSPDAITLALAAATPAFAESFQGADADAAGDSTGAVVGFNLGDPAAVTRIIAAAQAVTDAETFSAETLGTSRDPRRTVRFPITRPPQREMPRRRAIGFSVSGKSRQVVPVTIAAQCAFIGMKLLATDDSDEPGEATQIIGWFTGNQNEMRIPFSQSGIPTSEFSYEKRNNDLVLNLARPGIYTTIQIAFLRDCTWDGALFGEMSP